MKHVFHVKLSKRSAKFNDIYSFDSKKKLRDIENYIDKSNFETITKFI